MIDVAANLGRVIERIAIAARAAGRDPESVRLVAVAKKKPAAMVRAAIDAGARIVGENYVQEARDKARIVGAGAVWHLIGHLQRNKAREAAELFDAIQTLDNLQLAGALDRIARRRNRPVTALIQVNTGKEASKHGLAPGNLADFVAALGAFEGVEVVGLMTIQPPAPRPEDARPYFRLLRELRDAVAPHAPANVRLLELSMGMTDDFPEAIAEGATLVRVGRAIFGARE